MATQENKLNTAPLPHSDDEESLEATLKRMRELFASQETAAHHLQELYESENGADFHEFLDDLAYSALESNEEFIGNARKMPQASPQAQVDLRNRQRVLFDEVKQYILMEADLPTEASLDEKEKAQQKIAEILRSELDETDKVEIDDVLSALGMLVEDEEGKSRFNYPEKLFPDSTNKKWNVYNESVLEYFRIERAVKLGTRDRKDLEGIDGSRRMAHNAVAHDLDELLGLSELSETEWDFEKTRRLVTKMRDKKYPTIETAEQEATHDAIGAGLLGLQALQALNIKVATLRQR